MYKEEAAKDLEVMAEAVNYNKWIFDLIKGYLGQRILEVGGGIGTFTKFMTDRELVVSMDPLERCAGALSDALRVYPNIKILCGDICDRSIVERIRRDKIDTIVCLCVLEHIEDDLRALRNMHECLAERGKLILMVPAQKWVEGAWDRGVEHLRRYGKKELESKLKESGFRLKKGFYMNSIGLLGWFINSRIFKKTSVPRQQMLFFDRYIIPGLARVESIFHPPFGQSLVYICERA